MREYTIRIVVEVEDNDEDISTLDEMEIESALKEAAEGAQIDEVSCYAVESWLVTVS